MNPNSTNNVWFSVSMGLVGVIVGYGLASVMGGGSIISNPQAPAQVAQRQDQPTVPTTPPPAGEVDPPSSDDHIRGNPNAAISIIEYSDFQCPFCQRHHPTMAQVLEEFGDDVNWIYRHFPLSIHPEAQPSAEASECAADQGGNDAFWEYTDVMFDEGVGASKYITYAEDLGLDVDEFQDCMDSGKFEQKVKDQFAAGTKAGVRGTPGNIIYNNETEDSQLISGALPFDSFKAAIDQMLE